MVQACKSIHIVDGYALNTLDGYSYTSPWIKVIDYDKFSIAVALVGGSPQGTLQLWQSCDLEADTGANMGGGGGSPIFQGVNAPAVAIPRWADPYRGSSFVSDAALVPSGNGVVTVAVNGVGVYVLNQTLHGFAWAQVVYTATTNANTAITIVATLKG